MQTGKYKAVVFDLDGTAVNSHYNIDALQMTCIELLDRENLREPVLARIESEIDKRLALRLRGRGHVEFILFTAKYGILAQSPGAMALCERLRESK